MFERPHHQRIARVLATLDGDRLAAAGCAFAGGTAIALRRGEFRESVDIDFLVSDIAGYRDLRTLLTGPSGLPGLARAADPPWRAIGAMRADQYGLRTRVAVDDIAIKFEIVLEARIVLTPPRARDAICGVPTLGDGDLAACKLLANADRWADGSVFSRDIIDLAMLDLPPRRLLPAVAKARGAYGDAIDLSAEKALAALLEAPERLGRCMQALKMHLPPARMVQQLRSLRRRLAAI